MIKDVTDTPAESDPDALIHMLPPVARDKVLFHRAQAPELFRLDEPGLKRSLRERGFNPSSTDNAVRIKFWIEFERARSNGNPRIIVKNVLAGVCSHEFWLKEYLGSLNRVAWMCCMPLDYQIKMEETLAYSMEQLREVLELPIQDKHTGKINLQLAGLKAKIHMMIDMRLNGAPTQRVEQKSLSINVNRQDVNDINGIINGGNEKTLNERIRMLEDRKREASHVPRLSEWQTTEVSNVKVSVPDPKASE